MALYKLDYYYDYDCYYQATVSCQMSRFTNIRVHELTVNILFSVDKMEFTLNQKYITFVLFLISK